MFLPYTHRIEPTFKIPPQPSKHTHLPLKCIKNCFYRQVDSRKCYLRNINKGHRCTSISYQEPTPYRIVHVRTGQNRSFTDNKNALDDFTLFLHHLNRLKQEERQKNERN